MAKTRKQDEAFRDDVEQYLDTQGVTTKDTNYWRGVAHGLRWHLGDINYDRLNEMIPDKKDSG